MSSDPGDQTIAFTANKPETPEQTAASGSPQQSLSLSDTQQSSVAFAAELLESGLLTERELSSIVSDWSIHGSVSLKEHVADSELLTPTQMQQLEESARTRLHRSAIEPVSSLDQTSHGSISEACESIDRSGKVARLLGVSFSADLSKSELRVFEGRIRLIRKIGQGGLGCVWLARDTRLKRFVALKEISNYEKVDPAVVRRFKNEAEITSRLDHPSIVPIYQYGKDIETGREFYTMRFLGKSTLQDAIVEYHERLQEGDTDPMHLRHLLNAFVNVCQACGHAHSRKVIHRDLKPQNVVIDSFGQVILIDWGLAKMVDDVMADNDFQTAELHDGTHTMDGQVLGTPVFMAPEQAAGRMDELDHRTDIYGLGGILFAILTGQAPHDSTRKLAVDSGQGASKMISMIASGKVTPALEVNDACPPALDAICRRAMAPRRYARYQSATDLAEEVQRWMAGEPVTAYDESRWQKASRWVTQHRRTSQTLLSVAIILLVAMITLGLANYQNRLAAQHAEYSQLVGDANELELQLASFAEKLTRDTRFVASLPPIQAIVDIQQQHQTQTEDEAVWRGRLQSIYQAMLRSNSDYLAVTYRASEDQGSRDLVRVERNPSDPTLIRTLPTSRLRTRDSDALATEVGYLQPGDVRVSTKEAEETNLNRLDSQQLTVATPVFDEVTGDYFGLTLIETNLALQVMKMISEQGVWNGDVYVADGRGKLVVKAVTDHGPEFVDRLEIIPHLPATVKTRLERDQLPFELRSPEGYYAKRFYLTPNGRGILIFARLKNGD